MEADVTKIADGITFTKLMQTWDVEEYLTLSKSHFSVKNEVKGRFTIVEPAAAALYLAAKYVCCSDLS
jgi:hypothetical protein